MGEKRSACSACLQKVGRTFVLPRVISGVAAQAAQHAFISEQFLGADGKSSSVEGEAT